MILAFHEFGHYFTAKRYGMNVTPPFFIPVPFGGIGTFGAFIQLLPKGFRGRPYRQTDATVFCGVEGRGRTTIGDVTFDWGPRDVFAAPSWVPLSHEAGDDAVLFSMSDRPVQQALALWREQVPAV